MCTMLFWFILIIRCFCFPSYYIPFFLSYFFHSYFLSPFEPSFFAFKSFIHSFHLYPGICLDSIVSFSISIYTYISVSLCIVYSFLLLFSFTLSSSLPCLWLRWNEWTPSDPASVQEVSWTFLKRSQVDEVMSRLLMMVMIKYGICDNGSTVWWTVISYSIYYCNSVPSNPTARTRQFQVQNQSRKSPQHSLSKQKFLTALPTIFKIGYWTFKEWGDN